MGAPPRGADQHFQLHPERIDASGQTPQYHKFPPSQSSRIDLNSPTDPLPEPQTAKSDNLDFLKVAMIIVVVGGSAGAVLVGILAPGQSRRLVGFFFSALAAVLTLIEIRRGRVDRAYWMLTYGAWAGLTVSAAINGGMNAPSILAYPVLILIAGWVKSIRTALTLAILSVAAELFFVVAARSLPLQAPPPEAWIFFAHTVIIGVSASLAIFVRRGYSAQLAVLAQREAELSRQHDLYRALLDAQASAGVGLLMIENERVVFSNAALRQLVGYTDEELRALPNFIALTHPDDRERVMDNHRRRVAGETFNNRYDIGILTKEGRRREAEITVAPLRQEHGVGLLVITVDITERRRAEAMLREIVEGTSRVVGAEFFHALVRHLASALDVPIALVGEVRRNDPTRLHALAYWMGDRFADETDYELACTPCGQVHGQQPQLFACNLSERFPQAGGAMQAVAAESYYGHPLIGASGEPLGVLAIMDNRPMRDSEERASLMSIFAARAAAELERQRAEAEVRESEQKFSRIFQASPIAISISRIDDGRYLEINDAYARQFGWARAEILGRTSADIGLWANLDKRKCLIEALREHGRVSGYETLLCNRAGESHIILISAESLDFGGEECALSFFYDITERKKAEAEIRYLNAELEERVRTRTAELTEANRELESFAYSMSHDLRAPLRGIDGFSRLLQEEYGERLDDQGKEYLTRVRRAAQRLGTLIDDLLELSRVTRQEMRRVPVNLSALAADIVEGLRKTEPARHVAVSIAPQCPAEGDPQLLRVMLENLIGNAWKYTSHVEDAHIEFGCETSSQEPSYFVRDNGAGFDMAYAEKLFAPFQRLHSPTEFEGSGIGLASAARVVRRHGGKIWAESQPGQGAVFHFTLGGLP